MTIADARNVVRPLPLRVEDFLMLDEAGAFADFGKTELIDGGIVYMNAQHRPHARIKAALARRLEDALAGTGWDVLTEVTVSMPPHDAPEPDIVVTGEAEGDGPVPLASVALIIEVADATLAHDLGPKQRIYASHGVPEYWVVDVAGTVVHQMWEAGKTGYGRQVKIPFGQTIGAETLAGVDVETGNLV